jgi:hypothetical protein
VSGPAGYPTFMNEFDIINKDTNKQPRIDYKKYLTKIESKRKIEYQRR